MRLVKRGSDPREVRRLVAVDDHRRDVGTLDDLVEGDEVDVTVVGRRRADVEPDRRVDNEIDPCVECRVDRVRVLDIEC